MRSPFAISGLFVSMYCTLPSLILTSRRRSGSDEGEDEDAVAITGVGMTACTTPVPGRRSVTLVMILGLFDCGAVVQAPSSAIAARAKGVSFAMGVLRLE